VGGQHREERLELLQAIQAEYQKRSADLGAAVTGGDGRASVAGLGGSRSTSGSAPEQRHRRAQELLLRRASRCGTDYQGADRGVWPDHPWNWPINQIACKVFPHWRPAARWC